MTATHTYIQDLRTMLLSIPPDSILSRTFFQDEHMRTILFAFAPGQELSEHTASKPAIIHFLNGEARLWLGGEEFHATGGTWVHMPAQLPHRVLAETEVVMLLYLLESAAGS